MPTAGKIRPGWPPAARWGLAGYVAAVLLARVDPVLAALPLGLFVLACMVAPFCPQTGFFLPVVSKGKSGSRGVALTFDDGPDPASTPVLLEILEKRGMHATFFIIGGKAGHYPDLIRRILDKGHAVGHHSFTHDYRILFRSPRGIQQEILKTGEILARQGVASHVFRPPAGILVPALGPALSGLGMTAVNFSVRAVDWGNRRVNGLADVILRKVGPGDIIALHDLPPHGDGMCRVWREEVEKLLDGLAEKGLPVQPLEDLAGVRVMDRTAGGDERELP